MNPYPGMPPGMMPPGYEGQEGPGLFGQTAAGFGMGSGYYDTLAAQHAAGALYGGGVVSAMSGVPVGLATGIGVAGMLAPMAVAGLEGGGWGRKLGRGVFKGADFIDPTSHILPAMARGAKYGYGAAAGALGVGGLGMSAIPGAISSAYSAGGWRAGVGLMGRIGTAGMVGGAGAIAAGLPPLALGLAAYQGLEYAGSTFYRGAEDAMMGQSLMSQIGGSVAPGQRNAVGQGASVGQAMRGMAVEWGMETEDLDRYAQELNNQKLFQATKSVQEFSTKFREVMKAVKDIANVTKSTIDDAIQMVGDLRQQGFYTTADIKAQAASRQAREMATGISAGVYSAIGGAGAQTARQFGLRGRFGADLAERNVAGVSMGVRSGAMSEEEVMELGGVEAVGMRMAQQQMGFLQSARGRAMIAYTMGDNMAPDSERMNRMLRGATIEDIVTGAAGRGLGVLHASGRREAREQFAPYAGMAMVQMAAAQQRQLQGSVSERGIIHMLGTMGVGREEARLMLQGTMQMPEQVRQEQIQAMNLSVGEAARELDKRYTTGRNLRIGLEMNLGRSISRQGSVAYQSLSTAATNLMESITGTETYVGGDDELARDFLASGRSLRLGRLAETGGGFLSSASASERLRDQYRELTRTRGQLGMSDAELQRALRSGEVVDLGSSIRGAARSTTARGGEESRYARRDAIGSAEAAYDAGRGMGAGADGVTNLRASFGRGDFMSRMHTARRGAMGAQGLGGALASGIMDAGIGSMTLADADFTGNLQHFEKMHDIFYVAKEAKIIGDNMDYDSFMKKRVEERQKVEGMVRSALEESVAKGDETAGRVLYRLGARDDNLLNIRDIQSARDQFGGQLSKLLTDEFGGFGSSIFGGKHNKLALTLTQDGEARAAYDGFMRALVDGDTEKLVMWQDKLREKFTEDSPEYRAIVDQRRQLEDDPKKMEAFRGKAKGLSSLLGERAYLEKAHRDNEGLRQRLGGVRLEEIEDRRLRDSVANLGRSAAGGNMSRRMSSMNDLIMGTLSGGISAEERDVLNQIGGAGQGETIAALVSGVQRGGKGLNDADRQALSDKGYDSGKLKEIAKLQGEAQADALKQMFKDLGITDLAALGSSSKGAIDRRGVEAEYIASNEKFVQSVHAFVSALTAAGIKGVPAVAGLGSAPASDSSDTGSGSNTGGGWFPW